MFQILIVLIILASIGAVVTGIICVVQMIKNAPLDRQVKADLKAKRERINGMK